MPEDDNKKKKRQEAYEQAVANSEQYGGDKPKTLAEYAKYNDAEKYLNDMAGRSGFSDEDTNALLAIKNRGDRDITDDEYEQIYDIGRRNGRFTGTDYDEYLGSFNEEQLLGRKYEQEFYETSPEDSSTTAMNAYIKQNHPEYYAKYLDFKDNTPTTAQMSDSQQGEQPKMSRRQRRIGEEVSNEMVNNVGVPEVNEPEIKVNENPYRFSDTSLNIRPMTIPDNDKKKKKSRAEQVQEAYEEQAQSIENTGQEVQQGLTDAGDAYVQGLNDAARAQQDAYNEAQRQYQQRMEEGYTQFADIIAGQQTRADNAEQEAKDQYNNELKAARWTGATELAASLANLIAVGGYNASNQQYKSYSQDWMKQADANWRANRARVDNMRERQRVLQQQLIQMKMGDAAQAFNMTTSQAGHAYNRDVAAAQAGYQTGTAPLNVKVSTTKRAAAAKTQGVTAGINVGLKEAQLAETRRAREDSAAMAAAKAGLKKNKDGTYELDMTSPVTKASLKVGGGSGSSNKNTLYYYDDEGNLVSVYMTTKEYDEFVNQSYAALTTNEEFKQAYRRAQTDTERKSIIYQYAIQDPARRAVLSQYSAEPETVKKEEEKNDKTQGSVGSASDFDAWANQNTD